MLEPRQIRAARALLNWSQDDLANASGIARSSIKNIENDITTARKDTIHDIQVAFENSGIEFLPGSGVRIKEETVTVLHGEEAYWQLLDDVYHTAIKEHSNICILGIDETVVSNALKKDKDQGSERLSNHLDRLIKSNISERLIIRKGDKNLVAPSTWYRAVPEQFFEPNPIYIYGNKIAILYWGPPFKAIVYDNSEISKSLRKVFDFVWEKAEIVK